MRDVDDAQFKEKFEDVFETEPTFISPWYPALGDHDHRGSVAAQVEYGDRNGRWRMPSPYYARVERLKPAGVDANGADLGAGVTVQTIVVDWIGLEGETRVPGMEGRAAVRRRPEQKRRRIRRGERAVGVARARPERRDGGHRRREGGEADVEGRDWPPAADERVGEGEEGRREVPGGGEDAGER